MISTKFLQGRSNINEALEIRKKVFNEELKLRDYCITDIYDDFAFNVIVYEDAPIGTGRLLFKDGKYFIDNVCVLKQYRKRHLGDLLIRMLVRKAVNMGTEKTYAEVNESSKTLFENIGFVIEHSDNGKFLMVKTGDVGGHCQIKE